MGILFQASDQPLTVFPAGGDRAPGVLQDLLRAQGFQWLLTGDLRYADYRRDDCGCPYQKQGECRCREVMMLVYGGEEPPLTLVLQCRGSWTCVYLCRSSVNPQNRSSREKLVALLSLENGPLA